MLTQRHTQTNKEATTHTDKDTHKQTDIQTNRHIDTHTDTHTHTNKQMHIQTNRQEQTDTIHTNRQADAHTNKHRIKYLLISASSRRPLAIFPSFSKLSATMASLHTWSVGERESERLRLRVNKVMAVFFLPLYASKTFSH